MSDSPQNPLISMPPPNPNPWGDVKMNHDDEHKIALSRFAQTLLHTDEYIWLGPLRTQYGHCKFTQKEWHEAITHLKNTPVPLLPTSKRA